MLSFEREVVGSLTASSDPTVRASVEGFVDGTLRDLPEHLRAGVIGESILLGTYARALRLAGRLDRDDPVALHRLVAGWEDSPVGVVRTWVRLFTSLVIFAEHEFAQVAEARSAAPAGADA